MTDEHRAERAPERIALTRHFLEFVGPEQRGSDLVEYIRADLADLSRASALAEECERLRDALGDVVNPLAKLRRDAEAQGARLSGMAYQIANDLAFVQKIAADALSSTPAGKDTDTPRNDQERYREFRNEYGNLIKLSVVSGFPRDGIERVILHVCGPKSKILSTLTKQEFDELSEFLSPAAKTSRNAQTATGPKTII